MGSVTTLHSNISQRNRYKTHIFQHERLFCCCTFVMQRSYCCPGRSLDCLEPALVQTSSSICRHQTSCSPCPSSTLLAAVKAAGLAETLSGEGDFTVFAPTNDAFAKLPEGTIPFLLKPENKQALADILLRHVLPNRIEASQIPAGSTNVKTVGGEDITVTNANGGVSIKSSAGVANVIATDIQTSNGVVHLVDTVF